MPPRACGLTNAEADSLARALGAHYASALFGSSVMTYLGRLAVTARRSLLAILVLPFRLPLLGRATFVVCGFRVYVKSETSRIDAVLRQLAAALELVRQADSRRFARIRADVPRIYVSDFLGAAGYWWTWPTAITFDAETLLEQPPLWAAHTIAHEGMHARLRRAGIDTDDATRARVERRCVSEQIDLLRRMPDQHREEAARWIEWSETSLAAASPWYEPATRRANLREALAKQDAPAWLLRLVSPDNQTQFKE